MNEVDFGYNLIENVFSLLRLPMLTRINLEYNAIDTLRGFQTMEDLCYLNVRGNRLSGDLNVWYDTLFFVEQLILTEDDYHYQMDEDYEASLYEYEQREQQEGDTQ